MCILFFVFFFHFVHGPAEIVGMEWALKYKNRYHAISALYTLYVFYKTSRAGAASECTNKSTARDKKEAQHEVAIVKNTRIFRRLSWLSQTRRVQRLHVEICMREGKRQSHKSPTPPRGWLGGLEVWVFNFLYIFFCHLVHYGLSLNLYITVQSGIGGSLGPQRIILKAYEYSTIACQPRMIAASNTQRRWPSKLVSSQCTYTYVVSI